MDTQGVLLNSLG